VLSAMPLFGQDPIEGANVFGDLSYQRTSQIFESRRRAYAELGVQTATPDIAVALGAPFYLIAIARITAVQLPDNSAVPFTRISFHVEEMLRGASGVKDFVVQSRWNPNPPPKEDGFSDRNYHATVLDKTEPKEGDRYILGYTLDCSDGKTVFIPSAIDMQDPKQNRLIGEMKQFLTIESEAADSGFELYLKALDGSVPWIRDIAIHRLSESDACNASPVCAGQLTTVVKRQIESKIPSERMEALAWLVWVDSVSRSVSTAKGWLDGMPMLPDSLIRQLLSSTIEDRNLYIGDFAFEQRESFDFNRAGKPGECMQVVGALRKSAHWRAGDHDYSGRNELLPVNFPLSSTTSCIPEQHPKGR